MGCHTWFFKPSSKSKEQIKEQVITYLENYLADLYDPLYVERFLSYKKEADNYYFTLKRLEYLKTFYTVWLKRIQSNHPLWQAAIYTHRFHAQIVLYRKGVFYEVYRSQDVIRWGEYYHPDLYSYEDVLSFCNERGIELTPSNHLTLISFFDLKPTGGLITSDRGLSYYFW